MPSPLVECIPNFSEARRPEVVQAILDAITAVAGVQVLDRHSDVDHNRTVVTYVGSPQAVEEAAFQGIQIAGKLIDLNRHTGEHPRIGATDVVPFVPIAEISMVECVEMARRLGKRVGSELNIPVYLYEEAATRPERQNLENIRRGEFELLKEEIRTNPERQPDFGPAELGPAGATVIGARQPLIAFNIYLNTEDVSIAQKIAKAVRNSNGGFHYVKAMGVLVEGRAQVSMNLTNFHQTPIPRVVEMVRREAQRYGAAIHHSELVGLIPQEALVDTAVWYTQLDSFQPEQILENRLYSVPSRASSDIVPTSTFLDELATGSPTPGGGSAAAYSAAMAAGLVAMVCRLTIGKKKYAGVEQKMWEILEKAEELRKQLTQIVKEDAAAYEAYLQAVRLPKDTVEQQQTRSDAVEKAILNAAQVPLETAHKAVETMALSLETARLGNLNAISDAGTAGALAQAAFTAADLNVRTNLKGLTDPVLGQQLLEKMLQLTESAKQIQADLRTIVEERGGLSG